METTHLIDRALAAHYASHSLGDASRRLSTVVEHDGRTYVRLESGAGLVAVYRVHNDGQLRRMKQPPFKVLA